ncbi:MAG TPA: LPXTG cell wall anchor domain-containing protein [Anaerolineae bacterium]|nr:LPXTG cell wall anchor domain-containing protein [Anaerolineae bacterium]HID84482.1 LPXTG cell wall anchor domain-containing protein [Anaerolineales bacterium]HIQ09563.1 LPXTG cell wall anchor domain-containing protein [Anaerolineaceae bacterium]
MAENIPPLMPDDDLGFLDETEAEGQPTEAAADNRTFLYAVGALVAFMLIALLAMGAYAMLVLPRQRAARATQAAAINAQNTQIALAITQTAQAQAWTPTPTVTNTPAPTATPLPQPTPTPVVAAAATTPPPSAPTVDVAALGATATAVYLTQVAAANLTPMATPSQLPTTGFADQTGLPTLVALALGLLLLIVVVRRLRLSRGVS